MAEATTAITDAHIWRFQRRAHFHFGISYIILAVILALFAFAVYVFTFAQQIDRSKGSVEVLQELMIEKTNLAQAVPIAQAEFQNLLSHFEAGTVSSPVIIEAAKAFSDAKTKLSVLEEQINLMNETGYVADIDAPRSKEELKIIAAGKKELKDTADHIHAIAQKSFQAGALAQADELNVQRFVNEADLQQQINQQRASVALPAAQQKQLITNLDTIELVRTSLVRFGGVTVVLFLISLLTPIYRYNVRLGTFYQARADTLLLSRDTRVENFPEMIRLLTPGYTFEKEPTPPTASLASLLTEAGGVVRKI